MKYLAGFLDKNPYYQEKVKMYCKKWRVEKAVYAIKSSTVHTRIKLRKALVVSHFHYSAFLLRGIKRSLLISLEKDRRVTKSCFKEIVTHHDLQYEYLHLNSFLRIKETTYLRKVLSNRGPALIKQYQKDRQTNFLHFNVKYKSQYLNNCFFARATESWNAFIISNPISNNTNF